MVQVLEILPRGRQGIVYPTEMNLPLTTTKADCDMINVTFHRKLRASPGGLIVLSPCPTFYVWFPYDEIAEVLEILSGGGQEPFYPEMILPLTTTQANCDMINITCHRKLRTLPGGLTALASRTSCSWDQVILGTKLLILIHCPHEEKWQGLEATRNWLTMGSKSVVSRSTVDAYMRQYTGPSLVQIISSHLIGAKTLS